MATMTKETPTASPTKASPSPPQNGASKLPPEPAPAASPNAKEQANPKEHASADSSAAPAEVAPAKTKKKTKDEEPEDSRPVTVLIPASVYNHAKTLANLTGTSISAMVTSYLTSEVKKKLKAELAKVVADL